MKITLHNSSIRLDSLIAVDKPVVKLESDLERESCPWCGKIDCFLQCDESFGQESNHVSLLDAADRAKLNGGLDALESMLREAMGAGLITKSEDPVWNSIIDTVLDAIGNNV